MAGEARSGWCDVVHAGGVATRERYAWRELARRGAVQKLRRQNRLYRQKLISVIRNIGVSSIHIRRFRLVVTVNVWRAGTIALLALASGLYNEILINCN
jgi:hypothetical protein